jgi:hypothetical protein
MKFEFELDEGQTKKLTQWKERIKKKHGKYGTFEYRFSPTGIGMVVKVYSHLEEKEVDLTDVSHW